MQNKIIRYNHDDKFDKMNNKWTINEILIFFFKIFKYANIIRLINFQSSLLFIHNSKEYGWIHNKGISIM